ncbi:MAG: XRE family transcriptional regulator [Dehalococcoidales bacterium]|nr:XRE family transcriptional regulator [Dehalococcoidales bacterium]
MVVRDIPVNHNILLWARKEANLSPARAAIKAHIKDLKARGEKDTLPSATRLERWENGTDIPSFTQLENLAKAYRRPVLTFFLTKPPIKQTRIRDFRTIGNQSIDSESFSSEFSALLRRIESLQLSLHDLIQLSGSKPLPFVGSVEINVPVNRIVQNIRTTLDYSLDAQKRAGNSDKLFSDIRIKAEEKGLFILLEGNLGSYHSDIEPDVFRGVSISDNLAPLIVVNPNDSKTARIFTLIHEICHIWLGDTGVSNWISLNTDTKSIFQNELVCDRVAAEFLVPHDDLVKEWQQLGIGNIDNKIQLISDIYAVSTIVVARRIFELGYIERDYYWNYYNQCKSEWDKLKETIHQKKNVPSYRNRMRSRLGNRLISTVMGAAREGKISDLEASRLLSVKINHFDDIS